jgi:hypothetical protein
MAEERVNPAAVDDRVGFNQKGTRGGRNAAGEVHRPDSVVPAARNATDKGSQLTKGRALRAQRSPSPQKIAGLAAIDDRVDFSRKRAKSSRNAAAEVHRPDGVTSAVRNVAGQSNELTKGRAVRAQTGPGPQKVGERSAAPIDGRVDFTRKRAQSGRSAAAEVHQPDSVAGAAQSVTNKSKELTGGRAVRPRTGSKP